MLHLKVEGNLCGKAPLEEVSGSTVSLVFLSVCPSVVFRRDSCPQKKL